MISGGSGFLGAQLVRQARAAGHTRCVAVEGGDEVDEKLPRHRRGGALPENTVLESLSNALLRAFRELPARMREVTWHWATGIPVADTACGMGIAPATVRAHLHQARLRLACNPALAAPCTEQSSDR
ncbi:sigma factor-like helix-turn-helix DNA-binding protein [Streptomyces sp. NPDC002491]